MLENDQDVMLVTFVTVTKKLILLLLSSLFH